MTATVLRTTISQIVDLLEKSGLAAADTSQLNGMQAQQTTQNGEVSFNQFTGEEIVSNQPIALAARSSGQLIMDALTMLRELRTVAITP